MGCQLSCLLPPRNNNSHNNNNNSTIPVNLAETNEPRLIMLPKDPRVLKQSTETDYFCRDHSRGFNESMYGPNTSKAKTIAGSITRDPRNKQFEENARNPFQDPKIPGLDFGKSGNNYNDGTTMWKQENTEKIDELDFELQKFH